MNITALVHGIGSIGLFSSRIFLPAFVTSVLLRFGPDVPLLHHFGVLHHLQHGQPTWFTGNITLAVLGALSVLEIVGQKSPEIRRLLHEIDVYGKALMAGLTSLGVISSTDSHFVQQTFQHAGYMDAIPPLVAALGTWRVGRARQTVVVNLFDHLDGTHLDRLISWLEEAWVIFGSFLLVLFPVLMLLLVGMATGILFMLRKRLEVREEQRKVACPHCGTMIYPCAMACPKCRTAVSRPAAVGFLGQSRLYPAENIANHPYRLVEKRRCPVCATRLAPRRPLEPCAACGEVSLADPRFARAYMDYIAGRVPIVLMVCFLMSLVPVLGLIVGTVYYRMELVLPFSQYLPMGRRFVLRWMIRLLFLVLVFVQIVPLLGGLVVPLMALLSFGLYRDSFRTRMLSPAHADTRSASAPPLPAT